MSQTMVQAGARRDLAQIRDWYNRKEAGLGNRFLRVAQAKIKSLGEYPESYPFSDAPYRYALLRKFPHVIHFEVLDDTVVVFAVLHPAQDPERWRLRRP